MNKEELMEFLNRDIENMRSLNFSETYIKSIVENTSKWAKVGLLGGIKDPHIGRTIATLLENQLLFNEQWPPAGADLIPKGATTDYLSANWWISQWKRVSIPVVRRIFGEEFVGHHLVSVQAIKSAQENAYLIGFDGRTIPFIMESNTRPLYSVWEAPTAKLDDDGKMIYSEFRGQKYQLGLDAECEATAVLAENICNEITREIIRDLATNAGKSAVYEYKDENHLLSLIEGMSAYIAIKCNNREATWVVTSPKIVKLLGEFIEPTETSYKLQYGVNKIGVLNKKWQLFEDSSAPDGNILLGLKDHRSHYFSGYIYSPYLPVNPTPAWKTESQEQKSQMLSRYGKRILNPGFYGTIKIENLPETTLLEDKPEDTSESEE